MFHPDIYDCFRNQKCGAIQLWNKMEQAYLNNIPESGDKKALVELLIQVLVYYCKREMADENYGTKDTSLYNIITLNEVNWLPKDHRVEFKNRVTNARIIDSKRERLIAQKYEQEINNNNINDNSQLQIEHIDN